VPLAFPSRSHGTVPFGFFNIESDMLLLRDLFFFADRFCEAVVTWANSPSPNQGKTRIEGWRIADPAAVGNLHGAIAGVDLSGFIGATYRRYPFPEREEDFKQNPEGMKTQTEITTMIEGFGGPETILLAWNRDAGTVSLAEVVFTWENFPRLVAYVEQGGYPRWRDEIRPETVRVMWEAFQTLP
jgi:hypothetical protein